MLPNVTLGWGGGSNELTGPLNQKAMFHLDLIRVQRQFDLIDIVKNIHNEFD